MSLALVQLSDDCSLMSDRTSRGKTSRTVQLSPAQTADPQTGEQFERVFEAPEWDSHPALPLNDVTVNKSLNFFKSLSFSIHWG